MEEGVWSILEMGYSHAADAKVRWLIMDIKPIQVSNIDLDEYIEVRKHFNLEEWLDLLMHSIGLNPEYFNRRGKTHPDIPADHARGKQLQLHRTRAQRNW